jgi:hypothetical protein
MPTGPLHNVALKEIQVIGVNELYRLYSELTVMVAAYLKLKRRLVRSLSNYFIGLNPWSGAMNPLAIDL